MLRPPVRFMKFSKRREANSLRQHNSAANGLWAKRLIRWRFSARLDRRFSRAPEPPSSRRGRNSGSSCAVATAWAQETASWNGFGSEFETAFALKRAARHETRSRLQPSILLRWLWAALALRH